MKRGFITISGSRIYFEADGTGDPLIFLHADSLDLRQWKKQTEYFSEKYTVYTYDIRGFGRSGLPSGQSYSFHEDLHAFMETLHIGSAHLVGLSLGAAICIDFALTYPEKVRSMVVADPGISGDGFDAAFIAAIHLITGLAKSGDMKSAKSNWLNLDIFTASRSDSRVWQTVTQMVGSTSGYRWYGKNQPKELSRPAISRLREIVLPVLVLVGQSDIDDFRRKADVLHAQLKNSTFAVIPAAGHLSNLDNPDAFNREVDAFLSSV